MSCTPSASCGHASVAHEAPVQEVHHAPPRPKERAGQHDDHRL
eukprot:CAMPEP_0181216370 /NCGR_PEP_ID=MMETSP1096-20121128/26545_1 /TAXON_ID=156174 ORGANISM="Chrysochromulina ericina, Strain CCMP281" /NCGR_SAMPLE_ID=MMETSP1096 /ASSEMBLY_ACC=CAM_ASM_000453 /LENGTH=42 /DNA_ID= /DNA_START= /DNA_END= /DNA_ORIENTATION=